MPPIINFKICDNSADCNGITQCPAGVFSWNEAERTIKMDATKCTECGACNDFCPVDAIRYAKDANDFARLQKEFDDDPRTVAELFVDRYGATNLDEHQLKNDIQIFRNRIKSQRPMIVEFNQESTIECLLKSIPIADIQAAFHKDSTYSRFIITAADFAKYNITETPCLRFYYKEVLLGGIDGYHDKDESKPFFDKIAGFGKLIK